MGVHVVGVGSSLVFAAGVVVGVGSTQNKLPTVVNPVVTVKLSQRDGTLEELDVQHLKVSSISILSSAME